MATPIPALKPPPGVSSDFVNPPSLTYRNNISIGICVPAITLFFFLRCYVRVYIKRTWIFEDWLALTAWGGTVAFCAVGASTMAHNGGKHGWDITAAQAKEAAYWFNVASIHYGITICIAKLAVLWLYRRVFSPRRWSPFDNSIVFLIVLLILFYTSTTLVKIWECKPRAKVYNPKLPGTCVDVSLLLDISGAFNTLTDFVILLLPVNAVWKMNAKLQKKIIVVLVFTFGLCAPAFSLMGFIVRLRGSSNPDKTWVQPDIVMWGTAELTAGVLCVSAPETGSLFHKRKRRHPSASIVNGNYLRDTRRRKWLGRGGSILDHSDRTVGSESYIELHEGQKYDVEASREDTYLEQHIPGEVNVTQEIRVESHVA